MFKEFLSKTLNSRAFQIILSLILAFIAWAYISYFINQEKTIVLSDIPIEFTGEDYVRDNDLAITSMSADKVSVTFSGRRNNVIKLSGDNVSAGCDLSEIQGAGTFMLPCTVRYPTSSSVSISRKSIDYVTVTVEKLVDKQFPIIGIYDGQVADGYEAEPVRLSIDTVTVYGTKDAIESIEKATATLSVDGVSSTLTQSVPIVLVDEHGNEIDTSVFEMSDETVEITLPIATAKSVPLTVKLTYGAGATEENTSVTVKPSTITLSGDDETMQAVNSVLVCTVDTTKFNQSYTETYTLVLPNGTKNISGTTEATVTVTVSGLDSIKLSASNIETTNAPAGFNTTLITESLDVTIRGSADQIKTISADNIRIVADLSDLEGNTGYFSIPARVIIDGASENVGAVGEYKVTVSISGD